MSKEATDADVPPDAEGERYVVDRIEDGAWAVLEDRDGGTLDLPASWLPIGTEEGAVLLALVTNGASDRATSGDASSVRFVLDHDATRDRVERAASLRERLKRAPSGDLDL
ncbi:MAG: DUF3006 domain-containing protein [Trueperaceae bacterium]